MPLPSQPAPTTGEWFLCCLGLCSSTVTCRQHVYLHVYRPCVQALWLSSSAHLYRNTHNKCGPDSHLPLLSPILWAFPAHLALSPVYLPLTFLSTDMNTPAMGQTQTLMP